MVSDSDIIDNRHKTLVETIKAVLPGTERARFAVGYFFLSGLEALGDSLDAIQELRLLIGNTSNRETIEQLSEAYKRLDLVQQRAEEIQLARRADRRQRVAETAENLGETLALMDQTDAGQELVCQLIRMVEEGRLKVRVYTKGRLHAKAYIFDWSKPNPGDRGIAIVGSSNLTLSGVQDNTELNVVVHDNGSVTGAGGNIAQLTGWFEELWEESQDFDAELMRELRQSWAVQLASPYDVYMKTLYSLVRDRLDGGATPTMLGQDEITRSLADFQAEAVKQAIRMIQEYRGCFVADVVGLGKSFVGAAIVKYFERAERLRPIIICPKPLTDMWDAYNQTYQLNAEIVPMSLLREGERGVNLLDDIRYRDRNFVLIDESHNFRNPDSQRYRELQTYISADPERKVCLLTATPRNATAMDVFHQIKLFHPEDRTDLPIDPPDLRAYFKAVEGRKAPQGRLDGQIAELQDILRHLMIRRTRRHVLRWFGYASDTGRPLSEMDDISAEPYLAGYDGKRAYINVAGRHQYFPRRELQTLRYSIEETYAGLYEQLRGYLGKASGSGRREARIAETARPPSDELTYARYGLYNYVQRSKRTQPPYTDLRRSGRNLRGLIRTMLFKRFESSVYAFQQTLERMIQTQSAFLWALEHGIVPAGEEAERLLGRDDAVEEDELFDALTAVSGNYRVEDFDIDRLRRHIESDIRLMREMLTLVNPITPERDAKLQALKRQLRQEPVAGKKALIFTQYADTAVYLYDNLNPGGGRSDIEVLYGGDKSKARIVGRFAPKANPGFRPRSNEPEIRLLVATDVLAEGLNMQDCDIVINYDLHWNPVRLIQRFGRIDRIGSEHAVIWGFNFLPELGIERNLHLTEVLRRRIEEIHETIGEDAAILDRSEQLNPEAMYAIYDGSTKQLSFFEDDDADARYVDINEAEELLRRLRRDDPREFERIAKLPDGIRAAMRSTIHPNARFVFCQAGRFQQLFLVDGQGEVLTRDMGRVLGAIKANPDTPSGHFLPRDYNQIVMRVKRRFVEEVAHRRAQQEHAQSFTLSQQYILRELRLLFDASDDDDLRQKLNVLEQAFRLTPTTAVKREIDFLRRNGVQGDHLVEELLRIYQQHRLQDRMDRAQRDGDMEEIPRIVCSLAMV